MDDPDDEDEDEDDWESPEPYDQDDINEADEPDEVPCPICGESVSEMVDFCPHCRNYISLGEARAKRRSVWKWLVVIALVAMLSGLLYFIAK